MAEALEYQANEGTPDALPKGEAAQINDLVEEVDLEVEEPTEFPEDQIVGMEEIPPMEGNLTGLDELVFGPTDRPNEPITSGAPWGPGNVGPMGDRRTPQERAADYALYALNNDKELSPRSKSLLARLIRGD